ncbi:Succinyl-CoA:3-ketoacid coenzyme A transferase 1, mitochondrial [Hondaea fermentalgiana]|uniref:Succinyl-CoA:3-ketoacid coenzyme A transferase 1, mitochondrial n=1 Tax=Hondaea fermentalgiana TaxID=2315210 RepID=A0A2R5GEP4_9STRA|nr:Succinyl-CoA:3-ketoacid coenzyme A transferase 1, mitochondrial [Hondaea fermentalgiana]|eukprot:GBG27093.1 Succinyl-CoA:3-ketoacid coenzyme A transferase 1, mitochondrial [Hondaea fermentalgiana]
MLSKLANNGRTTKRHAPVMQEFRRFRSLFTGKGQSKVIAKEDAASLVRNGNTVLIGGFVCQSMAETVLKSLGQHYLENKVPKDLTLMFFGCGDPHGKRGNNHFAHKGMLRRAIGGHFGQSPDLHPAIRNNEIEAYALPMGAIARMVRSRASNTPGHFTKVGLGTFVDPRLAGGKLNEFTKRDLVEVVHIDDQEYLRYKPVNIDVSIIKATTADTDGNLTIENESVSADALLLATAARASGGITIAQVDRIAEAGTLHMPDVKVPGPLIDAIVITDPEDRNMGYYTPGIEPSFSGEVKIPLDNIPPVPMSPKKIMGRRAALELNPQRIMINLGIGAPEYVASIANEEGVLDHIVLTTEAGMYGGLGASGHEFGPAYNPQARVDTSQQFDVYNGSGLDICYLGAAEISADTGDVNVSKLGERYIGPGGFIDITQSTQRVVFMGTFTKKGLKVSAKDGKLTIEQEGQIPMFQRVREVTFSGAQALSHAQNVKYITERAVFQLTPEGVELTEVAPGVDLDTQILDLMDPKPIVNRDTLKVMDIRIFNEDSMNMQDDFFRDQSAFSSRFSYKEDTNTCFLDLSGISVRDEKTLEALCSEVKANFERITNHGEKKVHCVSTYERSDILPELSDKLNEMLNVVGSDYLLSVRRLGGKVFMRQKTVRDMELFSNEDIWNSFSNGKDEVTRSQFKEGIEKFLQINFSNRDIMRILGNSTENVAAKDFDKLMMSVKSIVSSTD